MFRLSIAWERVEPYRGSWNEEALNHYEKIILSLRKRNIEPLVTLNHFVLPSWLAEKGGLECDDFPNYFSAFALKVVEKLSWGQAQVKWWMTFNEPLVHVTSSYILGEWPPGKKSLVSALKASRNLAKAHNMTVNEIRKSTELPKDLKLGIAYHWREMLTENFGILNSPIKKTMDWLFNTAFLNLAKVGELDFLGINYYGKSVLHFKTAWPPIKLDEGEGPKTDLGWVIHPEGLGEVLKSAHKKYGIPIIISENGLADASDTQRSEFIKNHVNQVIEARKIGVNVIGYLYWSLTDNFEWAKGLNPRFGLVEVDYTSLKKTPRPSFEYYKSIIKKGI